MKDESDTAGRFTVSMPRDLFVRMEGKLGKSGELRSRYVCRLIEADLSGEKGKTEGKPEGGTADAAKGKTGALRGSVGGHGGSAANRLRDAVDGALLAEFEIRPELIAELDDRTKAQLLAQRVKEAVNPEAELEASYLSLRAALEKMPKGEELTTELAKAKRRAQTLESELMVQRILTCQIRDRLLKGKRGDDWGLVKEAIGAVRKWITDSLKAGEVLGLDETLVFRFLQIEDGIRMAEHAPERSATVDAVGTPA